MNTLSSLVLLASLGHTLAIVCPGLGEFNPDGAFEGDPDPSCPGNPDLELSYTMWTRTSIGLGDTLDRNNIPASFDPTLPTLFMTHGWSSDGQTNWLHNMKDRFLDNYEGNAVIVGWGGNGGSENINYLESSSTTRTVGAETGEMMMKLVNEAGGNIDTMHCTGHSLGAHVCGHAGRWAAGQGMMPGRITGMDPAGPGFAPNTNRSVGLYTDCAQFVDIIHTDWTSGSTPESSEPALTLGHQDYFPNDGHDQPGCGSDGCSHSISHDYFHYSLGQDCFIARETCTASNDLPGSCRPCVGDCGMMGYGATANNDPGIYRLETNALAPHCQS